MSAVATEGSWSFPLLGPSDITGIITFKSYLSYLMIMVSTPMYFFLLLITVVVLLLTRIAHGAVVAAHVTIFAPANETSECVDTRLRTATVGMGTLIYIWPNGTPW